MTYTAHCLPRKFSKSTCGVTEEDTVHSPQVVALPTPSLWSPVILSHLLFPSSLLVYSLVPRSDPFAGFPHAQGILVPVCEHVVV